MKELINSPIFIAIFMGTVSIMIAVWSRKNNNKEGMWDAIGKKANTIQVWEGINKKVNQEDYNSFTKRIGKQVDHQDDEIEKVGKAVAYIVGKMGGNYTEVVGG